MSAILHHLNSRRARLGAVAATAVLAVGGAGFATTQAWGQSSTTTPPAPATGSPTTLPTTVASGDQLTVAKTRVDLSVDRQVAAIDRVSTRIAGTANLSPVERTTVTGDLATLKSGLVALKAKVDAETTTVAIKADVKAAREAAKANTTIEVAALYARADRASAYLDAVMARVATIQSKLKASGADATAVNNALSDIQAKMADARNHLNGFDAALLSPEPPTQVQVSTATTAIRAVGADVRAIRKDVSSLRQTRRAAGTKPAAG